MIKLHSLSTSLFASDAPTIMVPVKTDQSRSILFNELVEHYGSWIADHAIKALNFTGKKETFCTIPTEEKLIILVGIGEEPVDTEIVRRSFAKAIRSAIPGKPVAIGICDNPAIAQSLAEGVLLGTYRFDIFRSKPSKPELPSDITIHTKAAEAVAKAQIIAAAVIKNRDDVNTPPNHKRPPAFAQRVFEELSKDDALTVNVYDQQWLETNSGGGLLSVCRGSSEEPRMVHIEYTPKNSDGKDLKHVAIVGKGITFDTGGISLKPSAGMETMKSDMAGASAVASVMSVLSKLEVNVKVTGIMCLAENMPDGNATRVSDVITMMNGKTVEVLNTDAEGRLVLADGLVFSSNMKPDMVIDIATLTGAQLVISGPDIACAMGNNDDAVQAVVKAGKDCGEGYVALPLPEDYRKCMKSTVADLSNMSNMRWAGTITAALFLSEFVEHETPWVHLDIAGPSFNEGATKDFRTKGGTGFAVRTVLELLAEPSRIPARS